MNRRHLIVAALAMAMSPARAEGEQPVEIVTKIYVFSAGQGGDYAGDSALLDKAMRKAWFSRAFQAALSKMDKASEPVLDFDPITSSQDPSVKRLKIANESFGADKAVVLASFFAFDNVKPTMVRYKMVLENGNWKVDDITGEVDGSKWSVRAILR